LFFGGASKETQTPHANQTWAERNCAVIATPPKNKRNNVVGFPFYTRATRDAGLPSIHGTPCKFFAFLLVAAFAALRRCVNRFSPVDVRTPESARLKTTTRTRTNEGHLTRIV
jgi:hypothetical protein